MSVYIKGMEMPKPGRYEATIIVLDESTAEIAISPEENEIGYWKEYPIISVPEHGDLIDKQYAYQNTMTLGEHTRKIVLKQIDALPVVIPADPVKEGVL